MAYTKQELEKAIEILNAPSKHIRCVHRTECGMEFKTYSADLVRTFEVAIETMNELKAYRDAEEQGLLLRLPCKYNDVLYWIANGYAQKVWFKGIRCDKGYKPQIIATYIDGSTLNPKETPIALLDNIGRTVFLTKEEAEQKLAEMKGE